MCDQKRICVATTLLFPQTEHSQPSCGDARAEGAPAFTARIGVIAIKSLVLPALEIDRISLGDFFACESLEISKVDLDEFFELKNLRLSAGNYSRAFYGPAQAAGEDGLEAMLTKSVCSGGHLPPAQLRE